MSCAFAEPFVCLRNFLQQPSAAFSQIRKFRDTVFCRGLCSELRNWNPGQSASKPVNLTAHSSVQSVIAC